MRENRGGKLYSLVYGRPDGFQIDPIELEPMYHMLPGHRNMCVFTAGCNFRCKHCQNWHISQVYTEAKKYSRYYNPDEVVEKTINQDCKSISFSINEPAIFYEYMFDIAAAAGKKGLKTLFHSNGAINPEPLSKVLEHIDAVTIDLKGFTDEFYRNVLSAELKPVLKTLQMIKKYGVHLEIVNLIIPTLNDNPGDISRMCRWIADNLGFEVPLHFTRFSPAYKLTGIPSTPVKTLEQARNTALESGLRYVYIGNIPRHEGNSTFCPNCHKLLIHRTYLAIEENNIENGSCKFCRHKIPGIWK